MLRPVIWLIVTAILVLTEAIFFPPHDPHHLWERLPGWHALLGLAGAVLWMFFAKPLGRWFLHRDDTYYEGKKS